MLKTYFVLVIIIKASGGVEAHDFDSKLACQNARQQVKQVSSMVEAFCFPKNVSD